ncbi:hypothetical protein CF319_g8907 [Tilletia indica]|nr:hypothetical protein CF319_g8907 [Tilletia indica]
MPAPSGNSRLDYIEIPPSNMRLELSDGEAEADNEDVDGRFREVEEERTVGKGAGQSATRTDGRDDSRDAAPSSSRAPSRASARKSGSTPRRKAAPRRSPAKKKSGGGQTRPVTRSRSAPSDSSKPAGEEADGAFVLAPNPYPQATAGWRLSPGNVEQLQASVVGHTVRSALEDDQVHIAGDPALNREFIIRATAAACVPACLDRVE